MAYVEEVSHYRVYATVNLEFLLSIVNRMSALFRVRNLISSIAKTIHGDAKTTHPFQNPFQFPTRP